MKYRGVVALVALAALWEFELVSPASAQRETSLYAQSAAQLIEGVFAECRIRPSATELCGQTSEVSYLLFDARTSALLASNWANLEKPIPLGSLVKPFTALAYGEQHQFRYPMHICRGTASGCWRPRGHGAVGLKSAIANSCNSYFRMLTADMRPADITPVAASFGLESPDSDSSAANLMGIGGHWEISPVAIAHAYLELVRRRDQPGIHEIVQGMEGSARFGTGLWVDRLLAHTRALAKTGTAPCTHVKHSPGDGFAIAMIPAERPQILLLVRLHGKPGAQAAQVAGELLRRIEE